MVLEYATAYLTTAVAFLVLDLVWLGWIAKPFYFGRLGHLLLEKPKMGAAAIFYALYVIGIVIFAVGPALSADSPGVAVTYGGMFGFFAYATYDMTNYATLRNWPLIVSVADTAWGTVLTGTSALLGYLAARLILG